MHPIHNMEAGFVDDDIVVPVAVYAVDKILFNIICLCFAGAQKTRIPCQFIEMCIRDRYADGGVWEGERILAEDYVRLATTNQNDSSTEALNNPEASDNFLGYGFQIWMCKPKGVYRADGAMGQFTIVSPEQDLLIAINETAVGAHWAQSTLNITWDFLEKVGGETLEEDPQSAGRLAQKMRCLNLPNPVFQPLSPIASKISGRTYTVQSLSLIHI